MPSRRIRRSIFSKPHCRPTAWPWCAMCGALTTWAASMHSRALARACAAGWLAWADQRNQEFRMKTEAAEIIREYGPFPGIACVHGVSYDGSQVWFATGTQLQALDPDSGRIVRSIPVPGDAGTAFDGRHLFQIANDRIQKIDLSTGHVLATIPAPGGG